MRILGRIVVELNLANFAFSSKTSRIYIIGLYLQEVYPIMENSGVINERMLL